MIGRFIGAYLTRVIKPGKVLAVFALLAASMVAISIILRDCSYVVYSSCWPFQFYYVSTIFTLTLDGLGALRHRQGLLCMAIVGGAVVPYIFGNLIDF